MNPTHRKKRDEWGTQPRLYAYARGGGQECPPYTQSFRKSSASVSTARWLAWADAGGRPPTFQTNSSLLTRRASSTVLPLINSVRAEPHAIEGTHPLARKRMSAICFPDSLTVSFRTSPQAGFSNCAEASGVSTSPALRGF